MRISDWSSDVCYSDLRPKLCERGNSVNRVCLSDSGKCDAESTKNAVSVPKQHEICTDSARLEIGRASCRERVCQYVLNSVVAVSLQYKHISNNVNDLITAER